MRIACWISKEGIHTLIIFNTYFPRQQWLRERALLRYTYLAFVPSPLHVTPCECLNLERAEVRVLQDRRRTCCCLDPKLLKITKTKSPITCQASLLSVQNCDSYVICSAKMHHLDVTLRPSPKFGLDDCNGLWICFTLGYQLLIRNRLWFLQHSSLRTFFPLALLINSNHRWFCSVLQGWLVIERRKDPLCCLSSHRSIRYSCQKCHFCNMK